MDRCGDCLAMKMERWPKGATVARCFAEGNRFPPGRVINYSAGGETDFRQTVRPAWCSINAQCTMHSGGTEGNDV